MKISWKKQTCRTKWIFALILFFSVALKTYAQDAMVNGAKPLSKGERAFSFDLGLDIPEPLIYGVRLDWGIADKYQFGLVGSFLGVGGTFGLDNKFNFWRSKKEHHFFSLQLTPSYFGSFTTNDHSLAFPALLVYEYRVKKSLGVFLKTGPLISYDDLSTTNRHWEHILKMGGGIQFQIGPRSAMVIEGGAVSRFGFDDTFPFGFFGKIGFTKLIGKEKNKRVTSESRFKGKRGFE